MINTTSSYNAPEMRTFSRNDLIKNLMNLLAFKYQIPRIQHPLNQDEALGKKLSYVIRK